MSRQKPPQTSSSANSGPDRGHPDLAVAATVHDVNQMLAVIAGRTGLLLEQVEDPLWRSHLEAVAAACRDAAAMVRRLSGKDLELGAGVCDPAVEARLAATLILPPDASGTGLRCLVELTRGSVAAVPGQILREVLVNLLLNAREAMGGAGTVHVSGGVRSKRIRIRVADDGPGISPEVRARLFAPGVSRTAEPGRGLGLAGCRQLLKSHGGCLDLVEQKGPGAVFVIDLPVAAQEPDTPEPARRDEPTLSGGGSLEKIQVLVVDDELSMREMLTAVLSEMGCAITTVSAAETALSAFHPGAFQVALLDEHLPGMSGSDLAAGLRKHDSCLAIFLMTGWGSEKEGESPDRSAIDFMARKPLEFKDLRRMLMDAVRLQAGRKAELRNQS